MLEFKAIGITKAFSELAHAQRGTRLEWAVIALIGFEILLSLYTTFFSENNSNFARQKF